jgi:hypothetical protein
MSDLTTPLGIREWARTLPDDDELMAMKAGTLKRIIYSLLGEIDRLRVPHHKIATSPVLAQPWLQNGDPYSAPVYEGEEEDD